MCFFFMVASRSKEEIENHTKGLRENMYCKYTDSFYNIRF